jgi:hypothetical protein
MRLTIVAFVIAVSIIAIFPLGLGKHGQVFPEGLSVFTLHAFGVFYLSLVIGALPALREKSIIPVIFYARTGMALIVIITLAAVLNFGMFDFGQHPGGLIYWGAYVVAGIIAGIYLARYWTYSQEAELSA